MTVQIMTEGLAVPIKQALVQLLSTHITQALSTNPSANSSGSITLNFRDPDYDAESGGYHPVEIHLTYKKGYWHLVYITDFSYVGQGWCVELAKELDFDFVAGFCGVRHLADIPLANAVELYQLFEKNFIAYYQMEVYKIEVTLAE